MKETIGLIGCGNMGSALAGGMIRSGRVLAEQVLAADARPESLAALAEMGAETTTDNVAAARRADVLFLAVKPGMVPSVASQIRDEIPEKTVVVSIAAGVTLAKLKDLLGADRKLVRVMPNTPALIGAGMSAYCATENVSEAEAALVRSLLESVGLAEAVPERLMEAVTAVSGSSPAYVYMFIEALADGAVAEGMPRAQAYRFAAQAVMGSAKMVLETGRHPGDLKDAVCSPGGTTIEAVAVLEEMGLRAAVIDAVKACADKAREMKD